MERVLIDTGPLVAILSARDSHHADCVEQLRITAPPMITSWPVITEAAWLLRHDHNGLQRLLHLDGDGLIDVASMDKDAFAWMAKFLRRYRKQGAQLADASLVYLAELEEIGTVFTLDRRDFSVFRFGKNRCFRIVPD